jgi:hypothetical protein
MRVDFPEVPGEGVTCPDTDTNRALASKSGGGLTHNGIDTDWRTHRFFKILK